MPYPRTCPCCSAQYLDDRSHISLSSHDRQGRRVVELLCLSCRGTYAWDFSRAQVFAEQAALESGTDGSGPSVRAVG